MNLPEELTHKKITKQLRVLRDSIDLLSTKISKYSSRNQKLEDAIFTTHKMIILQEKMIENELSIGPLKTPKVKKFFKNYLLGIKEGKTNPEYHYFYIELNHIVTIFSTSVKKYLEQCSLEVILTEDEEDTFQFQYTKEKTDEYETLRQNYLKALRNSLTFGKCAGELTELPLLYKAKLNFVDSRLSMTSKEKIYNFRELIMNSISKGLFSGKSVPSGLLSTMEDLEKILIHLKNNYQEVAEKQVIIELEKILTSDTPIKQEMYENVQNVITKFDKLNDETDELDRNKKYIERTFMLFGYNEQPDEIESLDGQQSISRDIEHDIYLKPGGRNEKFGPRLIDYNYQIMENLISLKNKYNLNYGIRDVYVNDKKVGIISRSEELRDLSKTNDELRTAYRKLENSLKIMGSFLQKIVYREIVANDKKKVNPYDAQTLYNYIEESGSDGEIITASLLGSPGQGKSTRMKQMTYDFVLKQLESKTPSIPLYINAKEFLLENDVENQNDRTDNTKLEYSSLICHELIGEYISNTLPDINKYFTTEELREFIALAEHFETQPYVLFIDALDELSDENSITSLLRKLEEGIQEFDFHVILSCRTTYKNYVQNRFNFVCNLEIPEKDLRIEMPKKLCDAWGFSRFPVTYNTETFFETYRQVLTHPLFVGWFCLLIKEDRLEEFNPEQATGFDVELDIMPIHVDFLTKIIQEGIKLRLKDSKTSASIDEYEEIFELFLLIAANSFKLNTKDMDLILARIKAVHHIEIKPEVEVFIRENLGVAYEIGKNIEWTHKTIPEVAFAILLSSDKFSDHYMANHKWSITTIIARAMQQAKDNKSTIVSELVSLIGEYHARDINTMLNIFRKSASEISKLDTTDCHLLYFKKQDSGEFAFEPAPVTEFGRLWHEIGCDYIERFNSGRAYPIAVGYWDLYEWEKEENDEKGLPNIFYETSNKFDLSDIFYYSNRQNSFIQSDELRVFDYTKIFARAKPNDLENLRLESVLRKVLAMPAEFFEEFPIMLQKKEVVDRLKNDFNQSYADLTNKIVDLIQYIPMDARGFHRNSVIVMHAQLYDWIVVCLRNKIDVNMKLLDKVFLRFANGRFFRTVEENQIDILWEYLLNKHNNSVEILFNRLFIEDDLSNQSRNLLKHITSNVEPLKKFLINASQNLLFMMLNVTSPRDRINVKGSKLAEVLFDTRIYDINLKGESFRRRIISNEDLREIYTKNLPDFDREMIEIHASGRR